NRGPECPPGNAGIASAGLTRRVHVFKATTPASTSPQQKNPKILNLGKGDDPVLLMDVIRRRLGIVVKKKMFHQAMGQWGSGGGRGAELSLRGSIPYPRILWSSWSYRICDCPSVVK